MRAVRCLAFGPPENLVVEDIPPLSPELDEVIVAAEACGVQFVDNRVIEGTSLLNTTQLDAHFGRSMKLEPPFTPGSEAAGIVKAVGSAVSGIGVGDRVLGCGLTGAMAEEVAFKEHEVCRIPDAMPFEIAACFFVSSFTSYYALVTRGDVRAGERVLVLAGASGVGVSAIQIAKALGAHVTATASSPEKREVAARMGADASIPHPSGAMDRQGQHGFLQQLREASEGKGFDVVVDIVGGPYAEPAMRALAFGGRYLSVGFAAGVPSVPMHVIFNKNGALLGIEPVSGERDRTPGRTPEMMERLFRWHAEGKLDILVSETLPLERAGEAMRRLLDRQVSGRIVLTTGR